MLEHAALMSSHSDDADAGGENMFDDDDEQKFTVRYQAGTYSGERTVWASDGQAAIEKVRTCIRKEMTLPMYSDSYEVVQ